MRRYCTLGLLVLFSLALVNLGQCQTITPIASVHSGQSDVTIQGVVTVAPGTFASSYCFDSSCSASDCGFAVEDLTGGIWVSVSCAASNQPSFNIGQSVIVSGAVSYQGGGDASNSILAINPATSWTASGLTNITIIPPTILNLGRVNGDASLITVAGTITTAPAGEDAGPDPVGCTGSACYGFKVFITDGQHTLRIFLNTPPGTDFSDEYLTNTHFTIGRWLQVTGLSGRYIEPEVDARFQEDIDFHSSANISSASLVVLVAFLAFFLSF